MMIDSAAQLRVFAEVMTEKGVAAIRQALKSEAREVGAELVRLAVDADESGVANWTVTMKVDGYLRCGVGTSVREAIDMAKANVKRHRRPIDKAHDANPKGTDKLLADVLDGGDATTGTLPLSKPEAVSTEQGRKPDASASPAGALTTERASLPLVKLGQGDYVTEIREGGAQ